MKDYRSRFCDGCNLTTSSFSLAGASNDAKPSVPSSADVGKRDESQVCDGTCPSVNLFAMAAADEKEGNEDAFGEDEQGPKLGFRSG
jgi:hypothetical protein